MWHEVTIICEPGFEDSVTAYIFESGFSGLEEYEESGRVVFKAFYSPSIPEISPLEKLKLALNDLARRMSKTPAAIAAESPLPDKDWETAWRESLGAMEIGSRLVIRPSWVSYENLHGRIVILIDPKMAFGTGGHATTSLCLEALETIDLIGMSVIDAGCGSGILSIAAMKLGALKVLGFDNDPFSVENACENVIINNVRDRVTIVEAELTSFRAEPCDLILANMISGVIIPNLPLFRALLKPEGTVIFSGFLAEEEPVLRDSLEQESFELESVTGRDEWIAARVRSKH
jgi:ribosomal protein L11 methyltransferase